MCQDVKLRFAEPWYNCLESSTLTGTESPDDTWLSFYMRMMALCNAHDGWLKRERERKIALRPFSQPGL